MPSRQVPCQSALLAHFLVFLPFPLLASPQFPSPSFLQVRPLLFLPMPQVRVAAVQVLATEPSIPLKPQRTAPQAQPVAAMQAQIHQLTRLLLQQTRLAFHLVRPRLALLEAAPARIRVPLLRLLLSPLRTLPRMLKSATVPCLLA